MRAPARPAAGTGSPRAGWSPDGRTIAHTAGSFEPDRWAIVPTDADSGNSRVAVDRVDSGSAAWSPDGTRLLGHYRRFGASGGDESRTWVLDRASGHVQPIEERKR